MEDFNREMLENLTLLSRIECTPEEQEELLNDLKKILSYFEEMQEVDTANVKPRYQVLDGMANVMRDDIAGATLPRDVFLSNAPDKIGGMIKVPPVLKQN